MEQRIARLMVFGCALFVGTALLYAQSWTTPWTATTGVIVTANQLNQTRDNLSVLRAGGLAISGQAANRIPYASSDTQLATSANLTFNGTTLTVAGTIVNSQDSAAMTFNRVLNASTSGSAYAASIVNASGNSWAMRMGSAAANSNALEFAVDALGTPATKLSLSTAGAMTVTGSINSASAQPGFLAFNSANDTATSGTVDFDTEEYDDAGNFAADTFTAPVTGRYLLCTVVTALPAGDTSLLRAKIVTTGRTYEIGTSRANTGQDHSVSGCVIAPMTASHTAIVTFAVTGGDIMGDATAPMTHFSGRLVP